MQSARPELYFTHVKSCPALSPPLVVILLPGVAVRFKRIRALVATTLCLALPQGAMAQDKVCKVEVEGDLLSNPRLARAQQPGGGGSGRHGGLA